MAVRGSHPSALIFRKRTKLVEVVADMIPLSQVSEGRIESRPHLLVLQSMKNGQPLLSLGSETASGFFVGSRSVLKSSTEFIIRARKCSVSS